MDLSDGDVIVGVAVMDGTSESVSGTPAVDGAALDGVSENGSVAEA